jgi:hypothetical protein
MMIALAFADVLIGQTLISYAVASVLGAGLVLFFFNRKLVRAASFQVVPSLF